MRGRKHTLYLEPGPPARVEMASQREELVAKLQREVRIATGGRKAQRGGAARRRAQILPDLDPKDKNAKAKAQKKLAELTNALDDYGRTYELADIGADEPEKITGIEVSSGDDEKPRPSRTRTRSSTRSSRGSSWRSANRQATSTRTRATSTPAPGPRSTATRPRSARAAAPPGRRSSQRPRQRPDVVHEGRRGEQPRSGRHREPPHRRAPEARLVLEEMGAGPAQGGLQEDDSRQALHNPPGGDSPHARADARRGVRARGRSYGARSSATSGSTPAPSSTCPTRPRPGPSGRT